MIDKELRHLNRSELLQMLITLGEENQLLKEQLEQANEKLNQRKIILENAGSIAQAALQLNGVFEAADKAVAQYLESVTGSSASVKIKSLESVGPVSIPEVSPQTPVYAQSEEPCEKTKEMSNEEYWQMVRSRAQTMLRETR